MSDGYSTFIEACVYGEAKPEDIDDWVQRWHDFDDATETIWQYLGMTSYEYARWVESPYLLDRIIASRKQEETDDQRQALGHVIRDKKQKLSRLKNEFQNLEVEIRDLEKTIWFLGQALEKI
ncbi:MAG: hypothetical protein ACYTBJ_24820 [Planctomycetota bacterium]|jgi:hypothetical protein